MTAIGSDAVLTVFVLFCRIGSCLMLMPGFSNKRVPLNVRLFIAISITLALTPLLSKEIDKSSSGATPVALTGLFISETLIGLLIGFLARIFFGALETLAGVVAMSTGLTSALAGPIDESEPMPAITNLIILTATALIFFTDLHWEVLRELRFDLVLVSDSLTKSFLVALRISSPLIVYALIINFAIGLAGKLAPQIPLYFITVPATIAGGWLLCNQMQDFYGVDKF